MLFKSLVLPLFNYCNITWYGRFSSDSEKLNILHRRCAPIMLSVDNFVSSDFLFDMLGWESLLSRNKYFKSLMMYKAVNNLTPSYISNRFNSLSNVHSLNTRSANAGHLALPPSSNGCDSECFKFSFTYDGVITWNGIDTSIRNSPSVESFKSSYKNVYNRK